MGEAEQNSWVFSNLKSRWKDSQLPIFWDKGLASAKAKFVREILGWETGNGIDHGASAQSAAKHVKEIEALKPRMPKRSRRLKPAMPKRSQISNASEPQPACRCTPRATKAG
jgi:hypothetical protein